MTTVNGTATGENSIGVTGTATGENSIGVIGTGSGGRNTVGVKGEGDVHGVIGHGKTWHGVRGISDSTIGGFGVYGRNNAGGPEFVVKANPGWAFMAKVKARRAARVSWVKGTLVLASLARARSG